MRARVYREIATGHEYQPFHAGSQAGQGGHGLGALQCQQCMVGHRDDLASAANLGLDVGNIADLAGAVDDHKNLVVALVEEHQVIDDAALVIEQQAVALFAHGQIDHVHRDQRLKRRCGVRTNQTQLAHVRNVKQTGGLARVVVFGHQASRVLHRHGIAGKRHHARAKFDVKGVKRCGQQRFGRIGHSSLQKRLGAKTGFDAGGN